MKFIIIHRRKNCASSNANLLRFAISSNPLASLILEEFGTAFPRSRTLGLGWGRNSKVVCAIPQEWGIEHLATAPEIMTYTQDIPIYPHLRKTTKQTTWCVFANGQFATQINMKLLNSVLVGAQADVLAVNAENELLGYHEKVRLTSDNKVAGFHRYYCDCAEPAPIPSDWPHYILIKTNILDRILIEDALPGSFFTFLQRCRSTELTLHAINVAGITFDLDTEDGLLSFCRARLPKIQNSKFKTRPEQSRRIQNSNRISQDSKLVGAVLLGKDVHIDAKAIIIGPTIISNNVKIRNGAVINSSIIGPDVCVPQNQVVQNRVVKSPQFPAKRAISNFSKECTNGTFRSWPRFSYPGTFKRIADCLTAIIVLILFAPIMLLIALAIKLTSHGPVFFNDKRQGLHGKEFYCLKFRSMTIGADKIQDKLRIISQVDGPQFKMTDDPRLTTVGRFLRDTYIDEIPQFFNVLLGQMSVVGPRPSPESENTLCPYWRDARLSVRPGITGLWQICRTRRPMKDFQEWIHWDSKYVRNLSLRMDLWIAWQTAKKLFDNFINQF